MNKNGVGGDQLIVVRIVDGLADARTAHLPGRDLLADEAPYEMRAACGVVGVVYAKGAIFDKAADCDFCVKMLAGCGGYASLDRYNAGCRCDDCKAIMGRYRRAAYRRKAGSKARTCVCGGLKSPASKTCMRCYIRNRAACGTNSMYARGCRCEPCREAHQVYMRAWHQRRRDAA